MSADKRSYPSFFHGTLNSYSLVFFSNNQVFAWILLAVTFFDYISGLAGLLAIIISNVVAWLAGLNIDKIRKGYYGFNPLLVGLGLGLFFAASPQFWLILIFSALLTLFLTVALEGVIGKYQLPYLSLPFLFGIWLALMASRDYISLEISDRGVYSMNEMYTLGGMTMVKIYEWFNSVDLPQSLIVYFRSLGAIFFQYHLFPGLLIAIGLLIYSRVAFSLSLLGFYSAYYFYQLVGGDLTTLTYTYIGFNFILTAIALGGFFIIPSWYSYLWVILLTPLTAILLTAFKMWFTSYQLSIYSLPFNIIVLIFLYVLKFRERHFNKPELVFFQQFSPERNLYSQVNSKKRLGEYPWFKVALPFWGEWTVTQAHNGKITHKENWRHAWDFEIEDDKGKTFRNSGSQVTDYYCYNKPVLAPADGWIEDFTDNIDDNPIGEINLEQNWGNTLVIRHSDHLFSALSHLKKGSIKMAKGNYVKKNDVIAHCGNSGRSPVPHLHFQFQATPQIGSKTLDIPLRNFILISTEGFVLKSFDYPGEEETVSNVVSNETLKKAFNFVPGQEIIFRNNQSSDPEIDTVRWEVNVDYLNNTYLYCRTSGSKAYFQLESDIFYFTHFEGDKKSLLFRFYLACYKVMFGLYRGMNIHDQFPLQTLLKGPVRIMQDFLSPFYVFAKSIYKLEYLKTGANLADQEILLHSEAYVGLPFRSGNQFCFDMYLRDDSLEKFVVRENQQETVEWIRQKNT